ncbi:hypothetical protein ACLBPI_21995, partial [Klebsiella pneumoniae]
MKRHYIFASHGSFANGLLNSVELILGKQPDIHPRFYVSTSKSIIKALINM